jgi:hypothetical protein
MVFDLRARNSATYSLAPLSNQDLETWQPSTLSNTLQLALYLSAVSLSSQAYVATACAPETEFI